MTAQEVVGKTFAHSNSHYHYTILETNEDGSFKTYCYEAQKFHTEQRWPRSIEDINHYINQGHWVEKILNYEIY